MDEARRKFDEFIENSYCVYQRTANDPATDRRVRAFDPWAGLLLAVPPMVGG